jgi:glucosamine--fructose-6-phosphate aminotransferase (isomerizing)
MNCGPEIGVASTKAFTSTLVLANVLASELAKSKKTLTPEKEKQIVHSLLQLPSQIEVVLGYDKYFLDAAETLKRFKGFLFMGRGLMYPIALEGALKMKELTYLHAEGYAAGEMKHGPLALIDENMAVVMLAPKDELYDKTLSNLQEAKARGAKIISVGTHDDEVLRKISDRYLGLPLLESEVNPILAVVPLQLMSFHLANALGNDVDQPRNLAKSVTVE